MILFSVELSEVETRLFDNTEKTKLVFLEETRKIEFGLALMRKLTQVSKDAVRDYKIKPNLHSENSLGEQ